MVADDCDDFVGHAYQNIGVSSRVGEYRMPARRNKPESYYAKLNAPGAK